MKILSGTSRRQSCRPKHRCRHPPQCTSRCQCRTEHQSRHSAQCTSRCQCRPHLDHRKPSQSRGFASLNMSPVRLLSVWTSWISGNRSTQGSRMQVDTNPSPLSNTSGYMSPAGTPIDPNDPLVNPLNQPTPDTSLFICFNPFWLST